jgi:hypothetical protein
MQSLVTNNADLHFAWYKACYIKFKFALIQYSITPSLQYSNLIYYGSGDGKNDRTVWAEF